MFILTLKSLESIQLRFLASPTTKDSSGCSSESNVALQTTVKVWHTLHKNKKHRKNCESCPSQVTWKVKIKYQICMSVLSDLSVLMTMTTTEWEKVWSRLSAHLQPFLALSAYSNNFRQKIVYFDVSRQKRVLFNCFATKQCLGMLKMWG